MTTATVRKVGDKFACNIGATVLGTSKHWDYFELHLRQGDVKVLREAGITKIEYVDEQGNVTKTFDPAAPAQKRAPKAKPTDTVPASAAATAPTATVNAATATVEATAAEPALA